MLKIFGLAAKFGGLGVYLVTTTAQANFGKFYNSFFLWKIGTHFSSL